MKLYPVPSVNQSERKNSSNVSHDETSGRCGVTTQKFAWETTMVMGAAYIVCSIFVALFPVFSTKLMAWLFHLPSLGIVGGTMHVSFGGFLGGFIQTLVYTYIGAWLFAWVFNRSAASSR